MYRFRGWFATVVWDDFLASVAAANTDVRYRWIIGAGSQACCYKTPEKHLIPAVTFPAQKLLFRDAVGNHFQNETVLLASNLAHKFSSDVTPVGRHLQVSFSKGYFGEHGFHLQNLATTQLLDGGSYKYLMYFLHLDRRL
jgi:hypothetical protein